MDSRTGLDPKIFLDSADLKEMGEWSRHPLVKGFTTNPSLMRKAGVSDYKTFVDEVLAVANGRPVSFEIFSDDQVVMLEQAETLASWGYAGDQIYVKIPVVTTKGQPTKQVVKELAQIGIRVNVTAVMHFEQVAEIRDAFGSTLGIVSLFCGRVSDTLRDPQPFVKASVEILRSYPNVEVLWASPREILNLAQATECKAHIITLTADLLKKLPMAGRDLNELSRETVEMFYKDALTIRLRV